MNAKFEVPAALIAGIAIGAGVGTYITYQVKNDEVRSVGAELDHERSKQFREKLADLDTTTKPAPKAGTIPGEGTFIVGSEIQPGTYRSVPAKMGYACEWDRLIAAGSPETIAIGTEGGPAVVTIQATDGGFKSHGCQTWQKIG
ncbi:hypothetical protein [Mycobacteroides immunogenum]|uniref:hypothetical protein n=1 Tax=Mycobacteroides immunogenum TaxID=83262 RepID=UPI000A9F08D9|nr:hypothetical protein [Mycobacteroides immunogenum]